MILGLVAVLDYLSGDGLASSIFYLIPVALVGWRFNIRVAGPFALVATLLWVVVAMLLGVQYASIWFSVWDGVSRFIIYFAFAALLGHVRHSLTLARQMALTDHLTGVSNSRFFRELAARELEHCHRHGRPFTLAYIDIDDFKEVNDKLGHSGGDDVIRTVANALVTNIRKVDHVARQGGDEFILFLHEIEPDYAELALRQIHERTYQALEKRGIDVSLSVGGITWIIPPRTLDEAINAADQVMYTVKWQIKGTVLHKTVNLDPEDPTSAADLSTARDSPSPAS